MRHCCHTDGVVGANMGNIQSFYRGLAFLLRLNVDRLVVSLALLLALYAGSYVMLVWF